MLLSEQIVNGGGSQRRSRHTAGCKRVYPCGADGAPRYGLELGSQWRDPVKSGRNADALVGRAGQQTG
ncbi:MAG: hypothetical protein NVSMB13_05650 [Mycobacteriales bacterium]